MRNPPAFQLYADDFLGGTIHFTDAEAGLYMRLLCVQWSAGGIPDNDEEIASYGKGGTPIARVKAKFEKCADGLLRNQRLESERQKQIAFRESRAANGKLGGRPCKASDNLVVLKSKATESSPSPISSLLSPKEERGDAPAREGCHEVPDLNQAIAAVQSDGIPTDFIQLAHADWTDNAGCNANGKAKPWTAYVRTRWRYEQTEWRNGTHRGKRAAGAKPRNGPKLSNVIAYAKERGEDAALYAVSWHRHWSEPKRDWKRNGIPIDWMVEFSSAWARDKVP